MVTRQNSLAIGLSVLLVASVIAVFLLYAQNKQLIQAVQESERKLSEQDKQVADLIATQEKETKSTYEALVSGLKEQIEKQEVIIKDLQEGLSLTFVDRILFEFGKANITPAGKRILKKVGKVLKNVEGRKIRVSGHTDNVPIHPKYTHKFPTNWELSAARAASVVRYFQEEAGLDPKDMEAVGRSFYQPVASNETKEGRDRNRRVEIFIAPKMEIKNKK
jgi:chemotaxis protein MotB